MLLEDVDPARPDYDDQLYFSEKYTHYLQHAAAAVPIVLDRESFLFHTLLTEDDPTWSVEEGENTYNYWLHNDDGHIPAVLHGQGPAKHSLIGIGNYIPGAFDSFYGTKRHTHVTVSPQDIYPLVIGMFFTEETDIDHEKQFVESIKSLDVDVHQTEIFVYNILGLLQSVCPILAEHFANCTNGRDTDEALARAEFLSMAASVGAAQALMVDSDVIVTRKSVVTDLAGWSLPVVTGHAQRVDKLWSNYWTDMDHWALGDGGQFYRRGFDTLALYYRERQGLFQVPYWRALVLIHNTEFERLARIYAKEVAEGIGSDIDRHVCIEANDAGLAAYVDNRHEYAILFDPDDPYSTKDVSYEEARVDEDFDYKGLFHSNDNSSTVALKEGTLRIPRERR